LRAHVVRTRHFAHFGSFNWYNTSILSHDLLVVVNHREAARLYLEEARQILKGFRVVWISLAR
jgi:hypothetical protein